MFKIKIIKNQYSEPGSFVGVILSHPTSKIRWKILHYNENQQSYYRSKTSDYNPSMHIMHMEHCYSHREISEKVRNGYWLMINPMEYETKVQDQERTES